MLKILACALVRLGEATEHTEFGFTVEELAESPPLKTRYYVRDQLVLMGVWR
jgi:hypothetical protein